MTKYLQIVLLALVGFVGVTTVHAQDQQLTQFYANPMFLNPAFAGTGIQSRAAITYRNQWPAIPKAFVAYNFAFDHYISEINSGIGLTVQHDKAGTGGLTYSAIGLQYAYEIQITRKLRIRPAVSFGFGSTFLDVDRLTFSDQLAREEDGLSTLDPDRARFAQKPVNYPDFGTGFLVFSKVFWFGASLQHLNEPVQSLTGGDTRLPKKLSVHGGIRIKLSNVSAFRSRQFIVPAFNYQAQGFFDQLDLGFYYEYDPIVIGLWYRGIPLLKKNGYDYLNHDAIAVLVGYNINNMKIGYSYDLTLSKLSANTGGAHELTWSIEFADKRNKRNTRRVIPCAKF